MVASVVINGILAFAYVVVVLYVVIDLDAALMSSPGFPVIGEFDNPSRGAIC